MRSSEIHVLFDIPFGLQAKHMTREQFAMNHPAGRIGRRLMLRVGDCMLSGERIPVARPGDSIMGCLDELTRKSCGCVLVTGPQQQLLGTFTDGDLRRTLQSQGSGIFDLKVGWLWCPSASSMGASSS